jgi:hypothetical protein
MPDLTVPLDALPTPVATAAPQDVTKAEAMGRTFPPLAKDIFPQGVRVVAVQGLPVKTTDESKSDTTQTTFNDFSQTHRLMLLIPNESREELSLALQEGDKLIISLMARGDEQPTAGFTYWDFEDLFKSNREESIGGGH